MCAGQLEHRRLACLARQGALDANRVTFCAPLCSSKCSRGESLLSRRIPEGWDEGGGRGGSPRGPLPALGARAIGPGVRVGGGMTSAAGWIIKAREARRTQSAPSRRCAALGPGSAQKPRQPTERLPPHLPSLPPVCAPPLHRHHAPLPTAGLRPAAHSTVAPALRSQARVAEGGCCRGAVGTMRGCMGGLGV